jgi:RHS repeat-associated protein
LSLAAAAAAELVISAAFHRDAAGRQWVVSFTQEGEGYLRRFDSGGALLAQLPLPGATDEARSSISSDSSGHVWVAGAVMSQDERAGLGLWHVSEDGTTLLSSATVFGSFNVYAGGVAVDGSDRVWVSVASQTADAESFEFALLRFSHDGSLDAGFPKTQQRPGGVLDGGLSIAVDSGGDVWSAGVSSNPATGAYDLALWKFDPAGALKPGFPVYRGSAYATLNELGSGIVVAASDKVWVAASQVFPGCTDNHAALFRFDRDARLELQRFWHNQAETSSSGQMLALTPDGDPWMVGLSGPDGGSTSLLWSYDRHGRLEHDYPKTFPGLDFTGLAVDNGGAAWVVDVSTPVPFPGGTTVPGAEGLPSCAQPSGGTITGHITFASSFPPGSTITVVASNDGFQESLFGFPHVSTGGLSFAYSAAVDTPGDFQIGAFLGEVPDDVDVSTPLGFYDSFRFVALGPGDSASGIDFSIALDTVAPTSAITFPVSGSTLTVLNFIEGTAADNVAANNDVRMAVEDLTAQRSWQPFSQPPWTEGEAQFQEADNEHLGTPAAFEWVLISSGDTGPFGRLAEYLAHGHQYRVSVKAGDFVGHVQEPASVLTFVWDGPTGDLAPPSPGGLQGQSLGVSSISWSWSLVGGATSYQLSRSSEGPVFASVASPPYADEGHGIAENVTLCVAAVNVFTSGPYSCQLSATDAAVPGSAPQAVSVGTANIAWSWAPGLNPGSVFYELTLSTDGFASHVATPIPVGFYHPHASANVDGLLPGTEYSARVRAYSNNLRPSDYSAVGATRTVTAGPAAPLLAAAFDRENGRVSLSWTPQGSTPAETYVVFRGTNPVSLPILSTGVTATSLLNVPPVSATYYYAVAGVTEQGFQGFRSQAQAVLFDATAPTLDVDLEDGATLSRPRYVVAMAFDDLSLAEVSFQVDGATRAATSIVHQFLWDVREESDGPHRLAVVARDRVGNETVLLRDVAVAYSTPSVPQVFTPQDDFSTTGTGFFASGQAPLYTGVSLLLDGVEAATAAVNHLGSWGVEVPFPGRGDFLLTARAFEARGQSDATAAVRVASYETPPGPVAGLAAAVGLDPARITVSWTPPSSPTPATSFRVERATSPSGVFFVVGSTAASPFDDVFPFGSGEYTYRVHAAHGSGLLSPPVSTSVVFDLAPPSAPANLRPAAYREAQGELDLAWDPSFDDFSGIARYLLERSPSGSFGADTSTFVVTGATTATLSVTLSTEAFRVLAEDGEGNRSGASAPLVFDPFPPAITGLDLAEGEIVSRPRFLVPSASDNVAVARAVYSLDGVAFATGTLSVFWSLAGVSDGSHQLRVDVYDAFGNRAELTRAVTVNYQPPAAPVITFPADGFQTNSSTLSVGGSAPAGTTVQLLVNGLDAVAVSAPFGSFFAQLHLSEEADLTLTAVAFEPRGFSGPSAAVRGVFTTAAPNPPTIPTVSLLSSGRARLVWTAGPGKLPTLYSVYRSTDDALLVPGAAAPVAYRLTTVVNPDFIDFPDQDGLYFYGVTALDGAGNESFLSEFSYALVDSVEPKASISIASAVPPVPPGNYALSMTVTEPLSEPPTLSFTSLGGSPVPVSLLARTATLFTATFTVSADMAPGVGTFAFEGRDLSQNYGRVITAGETLLLDTRGPLGSLALSRPSPINTSPLDVTLTLDEPAAQAPALSWTPSAGAPRAVLLLEGGAFDGRTWTGTVAVSTADAQGAANFAYSGQDALGNVSTLLSGATSFAIDTVASGAPLAPHANPGPSGTVSLSWSGPGGERPVAYRIFRDLAPIAEVLPAADLTGSYVDTTSDGSHDYAILSVDLAGNQSAAATVSATADSVPPAAPASLTVSLNGFGQIQVEWTAGSGESVNFRLYRATEPFSGSAGLAPRAAVSPFLDSPTTDGTFYYSAVAVDAAGNESALSNQQSVLYDKASPVIAIAGVENGAQYKAPVAPAFTVSDGNLNPASVVALLDGSPFASGSTVSGEGNHTLTVTATDFESHSSTASLSFILDFTAPSIAVTGVSEGAVLLGTAAAHLVVTDLHLAATGAVLSNLTLGTESPYQSGAVISRDGAYRLVVTAADVAGNVSVSTLNFSLDAAPIAPAGLTVRVFGPAALSWTKPEPDVAAYRVYRDGSRISASLHAGTSFDDPNPGPGQHVYEVSAVDGRGVEGPKARATVPNVTLTAPAQTLTRGFFDYLRIGVTNTSGSPLIIGPASFLVTAGGVVHATASASSFGVNSGASTFFAGATAVPLAVPNAASLTADVTLPTDPGASVSLVRTFSIVVIDPASPVVEALPDTLLAGGFSPVRVRFYNRGSAPLDIRTAEFIGSTTAAVPDVTVRLKSGGGSLLASAGLRQSAGASIVIQDGRQFFFVSVPPGESFLSAPVLVPTPSGAADNLSVEAVVSTPTFDIPFARMPGVRSFASDEVTASVSQLAYRAVVSPERAFYDQGSSVTLTGQALDSSDQPVPNVPVVVRVQNDGFERRVNAVADSSGSFRAGFFPLPNEAGVYTVTSGHPDGVPGGAQGSFELVGFNFNFTDFSVSLAQNSSYRFETTLHNTGDGAINGLALSSATTASGLNVSVDGLPASIPAGGSAVLGVSVSATPTASSGTLTVSVTESRGFKRSLPVRVAVSPAIVLPKVTPQQFQVGLLAGEIRTVHITLENKGFDTWRDVEVTTPSLSWVHLVGFNRVGDIPPGGNVSLSLEIAPPPAQPNATYNPNPLLQVLSLNAPAQSVFGSIAVTSDRKGEVLLSVINADQPRNGAGEGVGIPGAEATLVSLDVAGLTLKATADSNGLARFEDVPSGNYVWRAQKSGFQARTGTLVVEPGLSNLVEATLPTATVTYEWKVTPTTITDKYLIALQATFRTDVPAPVLVSDPPILDLNMSGGQTAFTQFTITNRGLITAKNVSVNYTGDGVATVTLPFGNIPEIRPGQSVVVPVKVTLAHASCHPIKFALACDYECLAGKIERSGADGPSMVLGNNEGKSCTSGGPSTGGWGSGGGGLSWGGDSSVISVAVPGANRKSSCSDTGPSPTVASEGSSSPMNPLPDIDVPDGEPDLGCEGTPMPPVEGSPRIGFGFRYCAKPGCGRRGRRWSESPDHKVRPQSNGTRTVETPEGDKSVFVPIADPLEESNGNGPLYAQPASVDKTLGTPSSQHYADAVYACINFTGYHGFQWSEPCNNAPNSNSLVICPGPNPNPTTCDASERILAQIEVRDRQGGRQLYSYYNSTGSYLLDMTLDKNGGWVKNVRDNDGKVVRIEDIHGRFIALNYDAQNRVSGTSDWANRTTAMTYDASGNLASITDVNGDTKSFLYDAEHRITEITYPNNGRKFFAYDGEGRVIETREDNDVNKETIFYHGSSSATITDALGRETYTEWVVMDGAKRITLVRDPLAQVVRTEYDDNLNPKRILDKRGNIINIATRYDAFNGVLERQVTDPAGRTSITKFLAGFEFPVEQFDSKGNRTAFAYDSKQNLIQVTDALGNSKRMTHDSLGHITGIKDALGNEARFIFNSNGAITDSVDSIGRETVLTRDALSRITRAQDAAGKNTEFEYDGFDAVTQITDALDGVTQFGFDPGRYARHLRTVRDAKNQLTTLNYDIHGRITGAINALGQGTVLSYNAKSLLESILSRNGQTTTYTYDDLDRIIRMVSPEGHMDFTYDASNNVTSVSKYNGTALAMSYDAVDRQIQITQTLPNSYSVVLSQAFDANGNRTSLTTPWGQFSYSYDALNRITAITNPFGQTVSFTYDAQGRRTKRSLPNGTETVYAYDAAGQILQIVHRRTVDATAVAFNEYSYDLAGNRAQMVDLNGIHGYQYDDLHRLISATHPPQSILPVKQETFSYDAVGNRLTDGHRNGYSYNLANRLISDSSFTYTYDPNGNRILKVESSNSIQTSNVYDSENRLLTSETTDGRRGHYLYDPVGRRVERSTGPIAAQAIRRYIYDGPQILAILDANNALLALFTNGPYIDEPLIMRRTGQDYFYHQDALQSVVALTDSAAAVVEKVEYAAYGAASIVGATSEVTGVSSVDNPYLFNGREWDDERDEYFYRNRQTYDPLIGRFAQEDPIGLLGGLNLYTYVSANPLAGGDPYGLAACKVMFPNYPVEYSDGKTSTWLGGHGGILIYDENGLTQYYEYGRYSPSDPRTIGVRLPSNEGNVRRITVPNVILDENGDATPESIEAIKNALANKAGKGTKANLTCDANADEDKILEYILQFAKNKNRPKYRWTPWNSNQCRDFAKDAFKIGR